VAQILNNLAILYRDISRYQEAEAHHLEALKIRRKFAQANPNVYEPDVADTLNNLALFYLKQGNLPTVRKYTSEALPICRRWYKKYPKIFGEKLAITLTLKGMATTDKKTACQDFQEVLTINPPEHIKQFVLKQAKQCDFNSMNK